MTIAAFRSDARECGAARHAASFVQSYEACSKDIGRRWAQSMSCRSESRSVRRYEWLSDRLCDCQSATRRTRRGASGPFPRRGQPRHGSPGIRRHLRTRGRRGPATRVGFVPRQRDPRSPSGSRAWARTGRTTLTELAETLTSVTKPRRPRQRPRGSGSASPGPCWCGSRRVGCRAAPPAPRVATAIAARRPAAAPDPGDLCDPRKSGYKSALYVALRGINTLLVRWARRKHKSVDAPTAEGVWRY